ncbi:MAG: cupin domain-containing protein [bacterium]|jgi:uncharacterized cupin superfamily protein
MKTQNVKFEVKNKVKVYKPSENEIEIAKNWPTWSKEISEFDWYYSENEKFYLVKGEVEIELDNKSSFKIEDGDMVEFYKGVKCKWKVTKPVFKHYTFF